ncbi:MAG: DUF58 domain-containing protein [Bacteroidota bacterium]|nr:DUF58 domain-containing protein [Bacteroidota bacterium]
MKLKFPDIFFTWLTYILVMALVIVYVLGFFDILFYRAGNLSLLVLIGIVVIDGVILFANKKGIGASRHTNNKLSNGDENPVQLYLENNYLFPVSVTLIDEIPVQFQVRNFQMKGSLKSAEIKRFDYIIKPFERGEYHFGHINVLVKSPLGLIERRYKLGEKSMLPVYPSFIQMRKYELLAISNRLIHAGIKKIRKIGNTTEFDHIKDYTQGDDIRTINWKAVARKGKLMVNRYQDEKAQPVYSIIDMGRAMKMPFEQLALLDYAINSSLVISNIAYQKHDKPGLITFSDKVHSYVPAERRGSQMFRIMETLYNQKTNFSESGFEQLYTHIKLNITHRSLLLLFTNFETLSGLKRQLKYLRSIAKHHLLVVIFFENTELHQLIEKKAENTQEIYFKTIAEKFELDKKLINKELQVYGIQSIYTTPQNLSVNTINKYLELKARNLI